MEQGYVPPTKDKLEQYREALEQLLRSPGWSLLLSYIRGQKQLALQAMLKPSAAPHEITRAAGAYAQAEELESWPMRNFTQFHAELNPKRK